jgi:predicted MFS family arabinose efflux permease
VYLAGKAGHALLFDSGMTTALVLGVPLGTLLAARLNWRATFLAVAVLGAIALVGIVVRLKPAPSPSAISLGQRLAVARRVDVLSILLLTVLFVTGAFLVNTYFGAYLETVFGVSPQGVAFVLFAVGIAAAAGNTLGGYAADHWDNRRFLLLAIGMAMPAFVVTSFMAAFAPASWALAGASPSSFGLYSAGQCPHGNKCGFLPSMLIWRPSPCRSIPRRSILVRPSAPRSVRQPSTSDR